MGSNTNFYDGDFYFLLPLKVGVFSGSVEHSFVGGEVPIADY